jgi:hypothetical protein
MTHSRFALAMGIALAALVSPAAVSLAQADDVAVFVRAGAPIKAPEWKEAGPEGVSLEDLSKQRKAMEDSLKKQYGKKREKWPPDKAAEFDALAARVQRRAFEDNYSDRAGAEEKDIEQSVAGIRDNLAKKKGVRVVPTAAEADFDVEVVGRFTGPDDTGQRAAHIGLRITPGGRLDKALLARTPFAWPPLTAAMHGAYASPWHQYSEAEPYWLVSVSRAAGMFGGMMYGKTEEHTANNVERLAKENMAALSAVRRP